MPAFERFAWGCCITSVIWLSSRPAPADDNWPQFRGPSANGVVDGRGLPTEWGPEQNVLWKVALPGTGWSQPIVWDGKIFVTTAQSEAQARPDPKNWGPGAGAPSLLRFFTGDKTGTEPPDAVYRWQLLCLDGDTGKVLWEKTAHEGRPTIPIHANNTYASETPACDGERLVAYFGMTGVYCYSLDGELLWSKDLGTFPMQFGWGTGSSPVLWGDHVYIQCDNDRASFLLVLDKRTGEKVWRVARDEKSNWSTPYVWTNSLRTELVTSGGHKMRSYHPLTGELLWELQGSGRTSTTPVANEELIFLDSYDRLTGGSGQFVAVRAGASGDITPNAADDTNPHVAWHTRLSGYRVATPLLYDGHLYITEQQSGIVRCLDAASGEVLVRKRLPGSRGCMASPLGSGGKVHFLDNDGNTLVTQAGPTLEILATNPLHEMCWASPAVLGNRLLLRTVDHLYCIAPP